MTKLILSIFVFVLAFTFAGRTSLAQTETDKGIQIEKDLALIRQNLRVEKKKIIAMNVPLTEDESTKFWPVYDQYAADMKKNYDEFYAIIKDYAENQKTLTDDQALNMIKRWANAQVEVAKTRQRYIPIFEKVIPGKKLALFSQVDRRLYELIDLQVASEVPLVYQGQ